jgi:hypothetical protein
MKAYQLFILNLTLIFTISAYGQDKPAIGFEDLMISAEEDFQNVLEARKLTELQDIPHTIYLKEGIFIEAKGVENNRVVYSIINNIAHPFEDGEVAYWSEIESRFDLSDARIHWVDKPTQNPELGYEITQLENPVPSLLMVPESTNDAVMSFNATTGDLLSMSFIPSDPTNLSTPIEALLTPQANILVSDQLDDHIVEYDTMGAFSRILYGGNIAVLDNCRGIELRPGANSVVGTIGGGANDDACPEFDLISGNYLGNFIANAAGGLDSPFDIIFRSSDCLVSGITSDAIHSYDLSGTPIGIFASIDTFPEQLAELSNGNIAVANFSGTQEGVVLYSSTGTLINVLTGVAGNRGVYQLPNGNFLTTNGSGVHELDGTGSLVRTIVAGVSGRYIREYDLSIVPVELTSFTANFSNGNVVLDWSTSTETNNSGFEILRSTQNDKGWLSLGFIPGFGTTTEPKSYSYSDESVNSGTYYYKLKQIDYDGSFSFSDVVEVDISLPAEFALEQNYPNPFNPSTSIQFSLPVDANVTIGVYNLVGEKVANVVGGDFSAGTHKVNFDASNLTSGIYFYRIDAAVDNGNNFSSVKKMTLLR